MSKSIEELRAEKLKALQEAVGDEDIGFDSPEWKEGDGLEGDSEFSDEEEAEIDAAWDAAIEDDDEDLEVENYVNPDYPEETGK